jgi:MFS family permease
MTSQTLESADRTEVPDSASDLSAEEPADGSPEPERPVEATGSVQPTRRANSRSSWQVLGQRDFRLYFFGSLISNLGTWLQSTAQVLIAYQVTHSVFMVGLIASAQFAGMVVSPWAPVLADRFSPRAVLVGTQGFSALIAILMAGLHFAGMLGVGWLLAGALGLGFAFALALPVQTALVPALVREEDAADAVKMNSVSYNAGRALAPALCVPVIIFIGPDLIFALNALSFAIFVIILRDLPGISKYTSLRQTFRDMFGRLLRATASLPLIAVGRASPRGRANPASVTSAVRPRARVRDGLITALQRRRLLLLLAIVAAVTFAEDPILVLGPAVAARLHMPSASAGYFIAALGWGSVLGSLPPTSVRGNTAQYASRRAAISLLFLGASIVAFTLGFSFRISLGAAIVAGAAGFFTGTAAQTALLRHHQKNGTDVAIVASVAALWAIAWAGTKPFASLADGWLAAHFGIVATSIVLAASAIAIGGCELILPAATKGRIIDRAKSIWPIVPDSVSPAPVHAGAVSAPLPDGMVTADAPLPQATYCRSPAEVRDGVRRVVRPVQPRAASAPADLASWREVGAATAAPPVPPTASAPRPAPRGRPAYGVDPTSMLLTRRGCGIFAISAARQPTAGTEQEPRQPQLHRGIPGQPPGRPTGTSHPGRPTGTSHPGRP